MRSRYAEIKKILEEEVLTLSESDLTEEPNRELKRWQWALDERIEILPSVTAKAENDLFIEWTYTVDLDLEIFTINGEVHY